MRTVRGCSLERKPITMRNLRMENINLYNILNIYKKLYNHISEYDTKFKILMEKPHIIWAMSILCRFFESADFRGIENKARFMRNYSNLLALSGLLLGAYAHEDIPYTQKSYIDLFAPLRDRRDRHINAKDVNLMVQTILDALNHNLLLIKSDQIMIWEDVITKNIFTK